MTPLITSRRHQTPLRYFESVDKFPSEMLFDLWRQKTFQCVSEVPLSCRSKKINYIKANKVRLSETWRSVNWRVILFSGSHFANYPQNWQFIWGTVKFVDPTANRLVAWCKHNYRINVTVGMLHNSVLFVNWSCLQETNYN